jgi:hypothetical protein
MAKKQMTNENWNVSFNCRDKNTSDDVRCISMNWENRSIEEVIQNLNTWLVATGYDLVVSEKSTIAEKK